MERHSVIIAWLAAIVTMTTGRSTYMVTVPQYIRPGEEFSVCMVPLVPRLGQTFLQFTLMDRKNKTLNFQEESAYFANDPVIFKIMVPEEARRTYGFQLEIKATGGIIFQKRVININLSSKTSSIFVQTDKAAYLPGDLVQFRVFGTNSKLKVLEEPMNITITDPKGNRVDQYLNVSPSFGVFTGAFQLSTLTNFGTWRIDIKQKKTNFQKRFTVEKHVLPKFVINIEFPEFQMQTDEFFYIDLIAKYTFGGPVEGLVNMTINRRWSSWNSINKLFRMRGKASVKILMTEIIRRFGSGVRVNVEFTERLTRKTSKDTQYTQIYYRREKLSSSSFMPYHFKPGVDYKYIVKLSSLDGAPLETPLDTMNVTVWYYVRVPIPKHFDTQVMSINPRRTKRRLLWSKLIDISDSGIVETTAQFPLAAVRGYFDVKYNKTLSTTHSVSKAYSASNNFLQVTVMNDAKAEIGKRLPILLETTERPNFVYYKVLSKGSLITYGRWVMRSRRKIFTLMITTDMAPSAKLLVYYVRRRNSEIVADAIIFPIEDIFKSNKVTLEFNKERALPGEKVDLQINADPHSLVNLLSVDKSVLLYKTGNDITFQDVMTDLQTYDRNFNRFARSWDSRFPRHIVGEDAFDLFTQTGLYVVTDALLFQYLIECDSPSPSFAGKMVFRSGATGISQRMTGPSANVGLVTPARVRKYFPATWIWTNTTTGSDGTALYTATTPDTITTWVTSAFAVNPSSGFALASEFANITTFQNFFMRFDLPYSAIRGEVVIVLISIFNFLPRTQEVYVTMTSSPDFDFVDNNGQPINVGPTGLTRRITVDSDRIEGVYVPIIGTKVGTITFNAQARSTEAADAVEQRFIIEAEGITQAYNVPFVVDLKQTNSFFDSTSITLPPNIVKDSEFIKIQVFGDLFGTVLNNIENLLRKSYGNGEQNLVRLVPSIYASSYLKATNRLTPRLLSDTQGYLKGGYQRQLTYSRSDGSFSGYGEKDKSGSTWLTAYVIKAFSQASEFIFIDKNIITKAVRWLIRQQKREGYFNEPGTVFSKSMQGGSASSRRSLTAFVLIALVEAKNKGQIDDNSVNVVERVIKSATAYVAKDAPASIHNVYELAISFYSLSLVDHSSSPLLLDALEKKANTSDNQKFWTLPDFDVYETAPWKSWRPPRNVFRAVDIETTSYVLLGYNLKNDLNNGVLVIKWLGRQRNAWGGYSSTQDTVIALQGLAYLGKRLYSSTTSLTVTAKGESWPGKVFNVDNSNALVLQSVDGLLPKTAKDKEKRNGSSPLASEDGTSTVMKNNAKVPKSEREITIEGRGTGICLVEVTVFFNVLKELRKPVFELIPTVMRDSTRGFTLKVCFKWLRNGQSSMGYLEVGLPSGTEADLDSLNTREAGGQFKKIEKDFRHINLYFDAILSTTMCITINVERVSLIARHKPVPIRLSEYYEPSNEVVAMYQSKALANATIIEVCGDGNCIQLK